jgi:hypothetical protein
VNYARIYGEFIRSRRVKEQGLSGYVERHHILPRCLGGGDEADNLIRLTAEDHFFAHLLLAKVHGGRLWAAVFLMAERSSWRDCIRRRRMYAVARERWAETERGKEGLKGSDNGNYNPEKFDWVNVDSGESRRSTLSEMWAEVGGGRAGWTSCLSGHKRTFLGWTIKGRKVNRGLKGKVVQLVNSDGRTFSGTQKQFCDRYGVSAASASRVCRHGDVTLCGWRLASTPERNPLFCKSTGRPNRYGRAGEGYDEKQGAGRR